MSHSRKHLKTSVLNSFPVPSELELVARVTELRGSNICEVQLPKGEKLLVQIPTRFRKTVWIKRGNFVIINRPTNWDNLWYKVGAMVQHVLFSDHVKHLKTEGLWPPEFDVIKEDQIDKVDGDDSLDEYLVNSNHLAIAESESDDDEEEEEEEKEEHHEE